MPHFLFFCENDIALAQTAAARFALLAKEAGRADIFVESTNAITKPPMEDFVVLLGDTVLDSSTDVTVTGQLAAAYAEVESPVTALEPVPMERISRYGVMDGEQAGEALYKVRGWIEKPAPEEAPSNLAIASRYVFTPDIFAALARTPRGKGNEIQLTDAMRLLLAERAMYGLRIAGKRYDLGSKLGFLTGTVEFGLRRPEFREAFAAFLKEIARGL